MRNFKALLTLCASLALGACATTDKPMEVTTAAAPAPPPIKVPVLVPCVSANEVPAVPGTAFAPGQSAAQLAAAARADIDNLEAYAIRADALLRGCVQQTDGSK